VKGSVLLNGAAPKRMVRNKTAFVMQDDVLFADLTVRETLTYSSRLKLPATMTSEDKDQLVADLLSELRISDCADTIIGGTWKVREAFLTICDIFPSMSAARRFGRRTKAHKYRERVGLESFRHLFR
jgi:ABC-type uncharacterized transport system YnjBCD ATPase subunit